MNRRVWLFTSTDVLAKKTSYHLTVAEVISGVARNSWGGLVPVTVVKSTDGRIRVWHVAEGAELPPMQAGSRVVVTRNMRKESYPLPQETQYILEVRQV